MDPHMFYSNGYNVSPPKDTHTHTHAHTYTLRTTPKMQDKLEPKLLNTTPKHLTARPECSIESANQEDNKKDRVSPTIRKYANNQILDLQHFNIFFLYNLYDSTFIT